MSDVWYLQIADLYRLLVTLANSVNKTGGGHNLNPNCVGYYAVIKEKVSFSKNNLPATC